MQDPTAGTNAAFSISEILSGTAERLSAVGQSLSGGAAASLAAPLANIGETLAQTAAKLSEILGAQSTGEGADGGEGDGQKQPDEDAAKTQERVEKLKKIWGGFYDELFTKEGKLRKEKALGIALEVGDTILGAKKMAKVRSALSIANVIRGKAEAIMEAAKSAPFPANLIPIAKAAAIGATQLGVVKGQAHDGLTNVPSTGTYLLERGERVVGRQLNADLQSFLAAQSVDPTGVSGGNTINNSPSINLTINGDASDNAVESNRHALEGMIRDIFADYAMEAPFG